MVGFALAWLEGPSAVKLGDLYVLPRYRGEGFGRALVYAVAELARSRGATHVHLTANREALAFYDRLAFREESRISPFASTCCFHARSRINGWIPRSSPPRCVPRSINAPIS
jgi:ribosomal protein S18 acetylase RimI-like enzyme